MAGLVGTKLPCQVQASHGNVIADTAIVLHRQEIDRTGNAENVFHDLPCNWNPRQVFQSSLTRLA